MLQLATSLDSLVIYLHTIDDRIEITPPEIRWGEKSSFIDVVDFQKAFSECACTAPFSLQHPAANVAACDIFRILCHVTPYD